MGETSSPYGMCLLRFEFLFDMEMFQLKPVYIDFYLPWNECLILYLSNVISLPDKTTLIMTPSPPPKKKTWWHAKTKTCDWSNAVVTKNGVPLHVFRPWTTVVCIVNCFTLGLGLGLCWFQLTNDLSDYLCNIFRNWCIWPWKSVCCKCLLFSSGIK